MSLIDKIDRLSITICDPETQDELVSKAEVKQLILSEQKEPCGWCKENYRFEFNWIDEDGNTVTTDDHMVIGGIADHCPICGRLLNQPSTDAS
jgi:hypothetical protein